MPRTVFETLINNNSRFKTQKVSPFQLSVLKNEENNYQKDASHLKNNKNSSHGKRYKKDIEKGGKMKNGKHKKSLTNVTTSIKLFTFIFCLFIWKMIYIHNIK